LVDWALVPRLAGNPSAKVGLFWKTAFAGDGLDGLFVGHALEVAEVDEEGIHLAEGVGEDLETTALLVEEAVGLVGVAGDPGLDAGCVEVRGAEPVQALVGFAEGVVVEYNGAPFDLTPHTARGLARFTLGQP